jgi:hypothetical protein
MFEHDIPEKAPGTLVIIGMQAEFNPALAHDTRDANELLLVRSLYDGYNVLFVERGPVGQNCPTLPQLTRYVKRYPRTATIEVFHDDAAPEIIEALGRNRFTTDSIDIAGVNTSEMIRSTVLSLGKYLVQVNPVTAIRVHAAACNDSVPNDFAALQQMWLTVPARSGKGTARVPSNIFVS